MKTSIRQAVWSACLLLLCTAATYTRADIVTLDLPDLIGTIQQGQMVWQPEVDFGVNFSPLNSLTIEVTATGVPGQDSTGAVPAAPIVSVIELASDVIGDPWIGPTVFGPYGSIPTADSVTQAPLPTENRVFSGTWRVQIQAPPVGAGLVTPAQIQILSATITADFSPIGRGCYGDINCDGFIGIDDLNVVLSHWNQNVTPGDVFSGDISGDGLVGIDDLNQVLGNWNGGTSPTANAVPEPVASAILWLAGLYILRRQY